MMCEFNTAVRWNLAALALCLPAAPAYAQPRAAPVQAEVDFAQTLQDWEGFGVNYVEAAQTRDYHKRPQEYGGFSTLSEEKRQQILEMTFGPDGLKPAIVKMFLDPFHEGMTESGNDNDDPRVLDMSRFDHQTTTRWMRYFVREGLKRTRARGADLQIITTLYGPPAWTTEQRFLRGRDLDPRKKEEVAEYMISWVKYLRDEEKFPVKYVSLHNEGECWNRWPVDGKSAGEAGHDYNLWWPSSQVVDFLRFMRPMMDRAGLQDVGLTPGETSNWEAFGRWYAWFLYKDPAAMKNLGLLTSHGFGLGRQYTNSLGIDTLRLVRPDLRAWTTSMSFGKMDTTFVEMVRQNIYDAKVNALIPWAFIQTDDWTGGDPNPGTAFWADGKGGYTVEPGYYLLKQLSRPGQPGTAVAHVSSSDPNVQLIAFAGNGSRHPDAFVIYNMGERGSRQARVRIGGTRAEAFEGYISGFRKRYDSLGAFPVRDGGIECVVPAQAAITFFAVR
ncbi:MAG: hypothetical protein KIT09_05525 [Bryobacteraceae bacterium]|nr:hypothetical protein [Bryobacteraceae bacterium]